MDIEKINTSNITQNLLEMVMKGPKIIDYKADFTKDGRFVTKLLADEIMRNFAFKTIKGSHDIYFYDDGYYKSTGKEKIEQMCVSMLGDDYKLNKKNEVIAFIQGSTFIDSTEADNGWINLENGLLNPLTGEFKPHTPEIFSIIRIPIRYDSEADCPTFKAALEDKLDPEIKDTLQEMFGYCYLPGQKFEKAFLLYGPRMTMKSTALFVLGNMLGEENASASSLQRLNEDNFSIAYQYGKMANIHADLSSRFLKHTETFMLLTGGDKITTAKKGGHEFSFYPSVKQIFSCNHIPPTSNKNLAFYRRWIMMPFVKQTPLDKVDKDMKEKLLKELPGILNWSLEGLKRLLTNNRFTYQPTEFEVKDFWEKYSDSIQSFIFNKINTDNDLGVLKKRIVYEEYIKYCEANDLQKENQILFGRNFKALTGCGTCNQDRIPAYKGVSFKGKEVEEYDESKEESSPISRYLDYPEGDFSGGSEL